MKVEFKNDRVNLHIQIREEPSVLTRILMFAVNICSIAIVIVALVDWLLGLVVLGVLLTLLSGWITLWYCFGSETLTINTRTLSFQHNFGLYKGPLETRRINRAINISLTPARAHTKNEHYNLIFETYNDFQIPEEIYRTTLSITKADFAILKTSIRSLYFERVNPEYLKQSFILN
jgi:hypothetical protein